MASKNRSWRSPRPGYSLVTLDLLFMQPDPIEADMTPRPIPTEHSVENWCHFVCDCLESADLWFGHGTDNAWDEAVWLVSHCIQFPATIALTPESFDIDAMTALDTDAPDFPARILDGEQQQAVTHLTRQRIDSRKPLAYLINVAWFAGLPFYVDDRVIIPRAHLGEWITDGFYPWIESSKNITRILDIGTGSGCIAIALALAFPQAKVHATDLDGDALQIARINAHLHGVEERVTFLQADVFPDWGISQDTSRGTTQTKGRDEFNYDLICSNPPYVDATTYASMPNEYLFEPQMAFVAQDDGTKIAHSILQHAPDYLDAAGVLFMEVGTARPALEKRYRELPLTWLASSEEEDVIFMIDAQTLRQHKATLS